MTGRIAVTTCELGEANAADSAATLAMPVTDMGRSAVPGRGAAAVL